MSHDADSANSDTISFFILMILLLYCMTFGTSARIIVSDARSAFDGTIALWRSRQLFWGVIWFWYQCCIMVPASETYYVGNTINGTIAFLRLKYCIVVSHVFLGDLLSLLTDGLIFCLSHLCVLVFCLSLFEGTNTVEGL